MGPWSQGRLYRGPWSNPNHIEYILVSCSNTVFLADFMRTDQTLHYGPGAVSDAWRDSIQETAC